MGIGSFWLKSCKTHAHDPARMSELCRLLLPPQAMLGSPLLTVCETSQCICHCLSWGQPPTYSVQLYLIPGMNLPTPWGINHTGFFMLCGAGLGKEAWETRIWGDGQTLVGRILLRDACGKSTAVNCLGLSRSFRSHLLLISVDHRFSCLFSKILGMYWYVQQTSAATGPKARTLQITSESLRRGLSSPTCLSCLKPCQDD